MFRKAVTEDLENIRSCVKAAFSPYIPILGKEPGPMKEDYELAILRDEIWLSYEKDKLEGFIYLIREPDHLTYEVLAVNPEFQGRGIGKKLLRFGEDKCGEYGYRDICLLTNEAFEVPKRMYPRYGYLEYKRGVEDGYRRIYYRKTIDRQKN